MLRLIAFVGVLWPITPWLDRAETGADLKAVDRICGEAAAELLRHHARKRRP